MRKIVMNTKDKGKPLCQHSILYIMYNCIELYCIECAL